MPRYGKWREDRWSRKKTVFPRTKKNEKQLVSVFFKGTVVPLLSPPPPTPPLREIFLKSITQISDNVLSGILGVTLTRKFDNLL